MRQLLIFICLGVQPAFAQVADRASFGVSDMNDDILHQAFDGMFDSGLEPPIPEGIASPSPPVPLNGFESLLIGAGLLAGAWTIKSQKSPKFGMDKGNEH